jgi:hypothetical protein
MKQVAKQLTEAAAWVVETASRLSVRRDTAPIDTVERVCQFARTRAAFVTQKKLYGYLKERIGTRYPKMFDDEIFVESINIAKLEVFAAGLADMTCFCVANATVGVDFTDEDRMAIARSCYSLGLEENAASSDSRARWMNAFEDRLGKTVWRMTGENGNHFIESPGALVRWAPIADELKRYDREIVENSIRFTWIEMRRDFLRRLEARAVAEDWQRSQAT